MPTKKEYLYLNDTPVGVGMGYFSGARHVHKFGHNSSVGAAFETLWDEGGIYVYPTSAITMQVSSSDIDDTSAGAGAQTIEIFGLDGDYNEQMETITLNGQTQVATANTYIRVFRLKVMSVGATTWNEGTIYIGTGSPTAGKPSTVYGLIEPFMNQSLMALYTIPNGFRGTIVQTVFTSAVAKVVEAGVFVSHQGGPFQIIEYISLISGDVNVIARGAHRVNAQADIELRARAGGGGGNISGQFGITLLEA